MTPSDDPPRRDSSRLRPLRTRVIGLRDDSDAFDRDYFFSLSPGEKMSMVPAMFREQWLLKGGDAELLRLRRDTARLQRRRR
jgi:hypothetical protein